MAYGLNKLALPPFEVTHDEFMKNSHVEVKNI